MTKGVEEKLVGKDVSIIVLKRGVEAPVEFSGLVKSIDPLRWITISGRDGGHIVFCGASEGIHEIRDLEGNLLYKNFAVPGEYTFDNVGKHEMLDCSGKDMLDRMKAIDECYDSLRENGVFY